MYCNLIYVNWVTSEKVFLKRIQNNPNSAYEGPCKLCKTKTNICNYEADQNITFVELGISKTLIFYLTEIPILMFVEFFYIELIIRPSTRLRSKIKPEHL